MDHDWSFVSFNCCGSKGITLNPLLAEESRQAELVIAGLVSGSGLIALVVKFIIATPQRETSAYKQGAIDEHNRHIEEISDFKERLANLEEENEKLRNGLVRLAVATTLSARQKQEIAEILGFKSTIQFLKSENDNNK
jgi:hypothetical protein